MSKAQIRISKNLMARKLDGEWVFLNLENGQYYGLNETASRIWDELLKHKKPEAVLERLQRAFGAERDVLERDLDKFLRDLSKEGLIEVGLASSKT